METEYKVEQRDGTLLKVVRDKTHFRAFDEAGQQVGPARIKLESLLEALDASIVTPVGDGGELRAATPETPEELAERRAMTAEELRNHTGKELREDLATAEAPVAGVDAVGPDGPESGGDTAAITPMTGGGTEGG